MTTESVYIIRRGHEAKRCLGVIASNSDSPNLCSGEFTWLDHPYDALQFARPQDAIVFIGAMRQLSKVIPHGATLSGLREGDLAPFVDEYKSLPR